jgi:hypothetical protein
MKCLIVGSSFAAAAAVRAHLQFKKVKITVVSGGIKEKKIEKKIKLISRYFSKYSNLIGSSLSLDNIITNKNDN